MLFGAIKIMEFTYVATCLFGLEKLLGEEIDALGYQRIDTMDGRVTFKGDLAAIVRCNIWLRFAERVYIVMGSFQAETFEQLFQGTKNLPWENWIGARDAFPVKGHSIKSKLFSLPDCQSIVKKAVVERMKAAYRLGWFEESSVLYQIEFFIFKDRATLMIDTSGTPLHKRGYRTEANGAPLRETLAAALAAISRPREDVLFWDPMCGSGTIAIEAAMIMANIAPGMSRPFAAEKFPQISPVLWREERAKAKAAIKADAEFEVYASDIDPETVEVTKENCRRAGVTKWVKAFVRDAREIKTGGRRGTVVCNPPYGERLMTMEEAENLYRQMGRHFATLDSWQIYVLTSHEGFERLYGRRADKVRKLYNGMIPCTYYQFFKKQDTPDQPAFRRDNRPAGDRRDDHRGDFGGKPHGDRRDDHRGDFHGKPRGDRDGNRGDFRGKPHGDRDGNRGEYRPKPYGERKDFRDKK